MKYSYTNGANLRYKPSTFALAVLAGLFALASSVMMIVGAQASATAVTNTESGEHFTDLQAAIDDTETEGGDILQLNEDLVTSEQVTVDKAVTIDGNGHTIDAEFEKPCATCNDNNSALGVQSDGVTIMDINLTSSADQPWPKQLHGVNVYESDNVFLSNVNTYGFEGSGVVVGQGSTVEVEDITASDNGWHDINVDKPGATLTISGDNSHSESVPHIYVDDITVGDVDDPDGLYEYTEFPNPDDNSKTARAYYLIDYVDDKQDCKNGNWTLGVADRDFRNQGDCVSHFSSDNQQQNDPDGGRNDNGRRNR